jgi:hypothetical protein
MTSSFFLRDVYILSIHGLDMSFDGPNIKKKNYDPSTLFGVAFVVLLQMRCPANTHAQALASVLGTSARSG